MGQGRPRPPESHSLVIVSSVLDAATERIIGYLSDNFGVPLNAVFFQYFKEGDSEFLTRTWLIDPQEAEVKTNKSPGKKDLEPWNGRDFYVNFGDGSADGEGNFRSWEDARRYGFISGGGGKWYSQTLNALSRGFTNLRQHSEVWLCRSGNRHRDSEAGNGIHGRI